MNNPLVSIIIPCYNAAPFVAETLESVIAQTYTNWECLIVDDHSTDGSWEIIESYQQRYPEKIFIHKNPRKGACAARNTGIDYAKGEYIQFLDADDLLAPNKLDLQIPILKENPNSIVYCNKTDFVNNLPNTENSSTPQTYKTSVLTHLLSDKDIYPHCWLAYTSNIKNHKWDESILLNQDGEFFWRVLQEINTVIHIDITLCYYRTSNSKSISRNINADKITSAYNTIKTLEKVLFKLIDKAELTQEVYRCLGNRYIYYLYQSYPKHKKVYSIISRNPYLKFATATYSTNKWMNDLVIKIIGWKFYKKILILKSLL